MAVVHKFKTLHKPSEGLYKEKGSKFIALVFPVRNEEEIKFHLQELRKQYFDARHHCYAFRLQADGSHFRANDDGEPSGSAGKPILGQLLSFEVTDVLAVVVRYFGGTKLGVGGLIQAYKSATEDALKNAEIIEKTVDQKFSIHCEYPLMNEVLRIIRESNGTIIRQDLQLDCTIECEIPLEFSEMAEQKWEDLRKIKVEKC